MPWHSEEGAALNRHRAAGLARAGAIALALLAAFCLSGPFAATAASAANSPGLDLQEALRASRAVVGHSIGNYTLRDREGRPVRLSDYRGKPLLVSFIYTGCFKVCPATTRALQSAVVAAQAALGTGRFNIVSIGYNQPEDSPQALKSFAAQNGIHQPDWEFLSPPGAIVKSLTRDFGFSFLATTSGFEHVLQLTLVDGRGRIYRQIYGESFSAEALIKPLKQLLDGAPVAESSGGFSEIVERVRLLCSVYDPATGEYQVSYSLVFEIAGGLTFLLFMLWFALTEWLAVRAARRRLLA
jgi:protein SCO1